MQSPQRSRVVVPMLVGVVRWGAYSRAEGLGCPHARGGGPPLLFVIIGAAVVVPMLVGVVRK